MNKIYCFNNGGAPGWLQAIAISEDGHILAEHICTHEGYMRMDLGLDGTNKHDYYNAYYGEGQWELEWVEHPMVHEGLQEAFRLNDILAEESQEIENE